MKNIQVRFDGSTPAQVVAGAKQAISQNMSGSSIIRPILRGKLHPSTFRSEFDVREIFSLKEQVLFLDYPLIDLEGEKVKFDAAEESDIHQLLRQFFGSGFGQKAQKAADVAVRLIELYSRKSKTTNDEAMNIIDGWKPSD